MVTMTYEGSDENEDLKTVPIINNNDDNYNIVSDKHEENFFNKDIDDKVKVTTKTTINAKVVQKMKKFQALYNDNSNKIIEQATQEKHVTKNSNFLINLAMVSNNIKPTLKEPQMFSKAWNHPSKDSCKKW